jgi:hypothetical protein
MAMETKGRCRRSWLYDIQDLVVKGVSRRKQSGCGVSSKEMGEDGGDSLYLSGEGDRDFGGLGGPRVG